MPQSWRHKACDAVCASVLPTLVIACSLEVIKYYGLLGWIEPSVARVVHAKLPAPDLGSLPNAADLRLVLIDDSNFMSDFKGISPLAPEKLAEGIQRIAEAKPAIIAIDLDISPGLTDFRSKYKDGKSNPHEFLYRTLCKAADYPAGRSCDPEAWSKSTDLPAVVEPQQACPHRQLQIVIVEPLIAEGGSTAADINSANCEWAKVIQHELGPCIQFATSDLDVISGRAIYFNPEVPSLGGVAYRAHERRRGSEENKAEKATKFEVGVCRSEPRQTSGRARKIINTDVIAAVHDEQASQGRPPQPDLRRLSIPWSPDRQSGDASKDLKNKVVFLGGTWGNADKHATAWIDNVDGVVIHAAIFYSLLVPKDIRDVVGLLVDVAVGVALGAAFHVCWHCYGARISLFSAAGGHGAVFCRREEREKDPQLFEAYPWALFFGGLAWLFLFLGVSGALYFSFLYLRAGSWLNPAAMVIGLFVHSLVSSRPELAHDKHGNTGESLCGGRWERAWKCAAKFCSRTIEVANMARSHPMGAIAFAIRWILIVGVIGWGVGIVARHH